MSISAYMRTVVEITLESISQTSYSEFVNKVSDPICYAAISLKPMDGMAAIEISPSLVFPMIDRLPGRSGLQLPKARSMTEIERSIMQNVLKLLVDKLKESWRPVYPLDFVLTAIEAHPHMVQVTSPNENVIHFQFHARKGENASFPMGSLLSLQVGDTLVLDQREHWPVIIKVSSKTKFHVRRQMDSMRKAFGIIGHIRPRREESGNGYISQ